MEKHADIYFLARLDRKKCVRSDGIQNDEILGGGGYFQAKFLIEKNSNKYLLSSLAFLLLLLD